MLPIYASICSPFHPACFAADGSHLEHCRCHLLPCMAPDDFDDAGYFVIGEPEQLHSRYYLMFEKESLYAAGVLL